MFELLDTVPNPTGGAVSSAKFSPDGKFLAFASADCSVHLFGIDRKPIRSFIGHTKGISDVSWSQCSQMLCSASDDKSILLWNINTPTPMGILEGHTSPVFCCNFNPQGNLIASGAFDDQVRIWDVKQGVCIRVLPAHTDPVSAVCFNRDGTLLATSGYDGLIRVWNTDSGQCLKTLICDSNPGVFHIKFSPNSKYILASTFDGTLRLWNYAQGKAVKCYTGFRNQNYPCPSAFLVGRMQIIAGSEDGLLHFWDLQSMELELQFKAHDAPLICVATHPTMDLIATASIAKGDGVKLWTFSGGVGTARRLSVHGSVDISEES